MLPFFRSALLSLAFVPVAGRIGAQTSMRLVDQGWYADPEIHLFENSYWLFPTYSRQTHPPAIAPSFTPSQTQRRASAHVPPAYLQQTFLDAFSSPDLVHWTRHPHVLNIQNVPWAAYAVWAPSVIHAQGKYFLFFGANDIQKDQTTLLGGVGLAVSEHPEGPFRDALGKPLIGHFENGAQPIDPFAFQDDDGSIYLYYGGQGHCNVARLSPNLRQIVPLPGGELYKEITPEHYVEGPFLIKRLGVYYFMWSEGGWTGPDYSVAYAKSNSPTGPFIRAGKILQTDPAIATGPGHHSVLNIPGTDDWYIAYHRHPLGTTGGDERVLAIDRMVFDEKGDILPIKMTAEGPPARPLPAAALAP